MRYSIKVSSYKNFRDTTMFELFIKVDLGLGYEPILEHFNTDNPGELVDFTREIFAKIKRGYEPKSIADLNYRNDLMLINSSQDVEYLRELLPGIDLQYDGFFVGIENGDYSEVYGFMGSVPYNHKAIYKVL